jgi:hypothetical protein
MANIPPNYNNFGLYIPTTTLFDIGEIQEVDINSEEFKELLVRLYQTVNNIALATNLKETGYFLTQEFVTGSLYFNVNNDFNNTRPVYRTVVNFGALPSTGTKTVAHGIPNVTNTFSVVRIYGAATNPTSVDFIPIPYPSATSVTDQLELSADATNVYITTGGTDYSAYTTTYVIIEYIKE